MNQNYTRYTELLRKVADIQNAAALLNWDQETYMPPKGAAFRAQQLSTLAGIAHELATSKELGDLLEALSNDKTLSDREQKKNKIIIIQNTTLRKIQFLLAKLKSDNIELPFDSNIIGMQN